MQRILIFGEPEQMGTDEEVEREVKEAEAEEAAIESEEAEAREEEAFCAKIAKRSIKQLSMRFDTPPKKKKRNKVY